MDPTPPRVQLSCEQCQRRKTKCDKTSPCHACRKAGLNCTSVQRHRLPRGRSGNTKANASINAALKDRVIKLEAAVQRLQREEPTVPTLRAENDDSFVAPGFWDELMDAVGGLRDVLEAPDVESDESSLVPSPEPARSGARNADGAAALLLGGSGSSVPTQASRPSSQERAWLHGLYRDRVDKIFKVLHWPTAHAAVDYESTTQVTVEVEALEYAIYFVAVCTTMPYEFENRDSTIGRYRLASEAALIRANLLTTRSLTTLQAFVLYLVGLRSCESDAQTWTLLACAIRIASAQGLDEKSYRHKSPLETETRNRVWYSIAVLDVRCAFDRGSKPLLSSSAFPAMPLNLDDREISTETVHVNGRSDSTYTSMSYCRMNYKALLCQLKIMELGESTITDKQRDHSAMIWRQQLEALADFEDFHDKFTRICLQDPTPFRRLAANISTESLTSMKLLSCRPFYKQARDLHAISQDSFNVLATATEVLETSALKAHSQDFAPWAWFSWPKWFALAIVLAELCGRQEGEMIDRAWLAAQACYGRYMHQVADMPSGLLWRPIAKLMKRASAVRKTINPAAVNVVSPPVYESTDSEPHLQAIPSDSYMTGTQKLFPPTPADFNDPLMDTNFENMEGMSWFNWELFVDDLNSQDFSMNLDETYLG
nr:c6 finger domain transcription factor nscr [Quercus suber]